MNCPKCLKGDLVEVGVDNYIDAVIERCSECGQEFYRAIPDWKISGTADSDLNGVYIIDEKKREGERVDTQGS